MQGTPKVRFGPGVVPGEGLPAPGQLGGGELPTLPPLLLGGQLSPSEGLFWGRKVRK